MENDEFLRIEALQRALAYYAGKTTTPSDVTHVAKIFYEFLKGETK
jgi:hypothetical protein